MTEPQWLGSQDPFGMLDFIADKVSERKLRLFVASCCRRIESLFPHLGGQTCLNVVDRWADALATDQEVEEAVSRVLVGWEPEQEIETVIRENIADALLEICERSGNPVEVARGVSLRTRDAATASGASSTSEAKAQATALRDIVGNPFHKQSLDPACLTSQVSHVANANYQQPRFDNLRVLGDTLEEAGCMDLEVLSHCRESGPHVRGCWVVDLILGKN